MNNSLPASNGNGAVSPHSRLWVVARPIILAVGVVLAIAGQMVLVCTWAPDRRLAPGLPGFALLAGGMALFAAATWRRTRAEDTNEPRAFFPLHPALEAVLVGLLLLQTIAIRVYDLDGIPYGVFVDETEMAIGALDLMRAGTWNLFDTGWYEVTTLYMNTQALFFRMLGISIFSLRLAAVVWGTLTVAALYFLARYLWGPGWAFLASMLLATARWHVNLSRAGFVLVQAAMWLCLIMLCWAWATRLRPGSEEEPDRLGNARRAIAALGATGAALLVWLAGHWIGWYLLLPWHGILVALAAALLYFLLLWVFRWPADMRAVPFLLCGVCLGWSLYSYLPSRVNPIIVFGCVCFLTMARSEAPTGLKGFAYGSAFLALPAGVGLVISVFDGAGWLWWPSVVVLGVALVTGTVCTVLIGFGFPGFLRQHGLHILALFAVAATIFYPLYRTYREHPNKFVRRANEVRIDTDMRREQSSLPLWINEARYLTMFNFKASDLARHNIPFWPAVHPVTGVCAALGLGIALSRWWRPLYGVLLIWFLLGLQTGALTVGGDFAAVIRVTHVLPAVMLLAVLSLREVGLTIMALAPGSIWLQRIWLVVAVLLLSIPWVAEPKIYFSRQVNSTTSEFAATNGDITTIAYRIRDRLAQGARVYVDPPLVMSQVRVINWPDSQLVLFSPEKASPFEYKPGRDIFLYVTDRQPGVVDDLRLWYPSTTIVPLTHARLTVPFAYEVRVPEQDLAASLGADVVYAATLPEGTRATYSTVAPGPHAIWSAAIDCALLDQLALASWPAGTITSVTCRSVWMARRGGQYVLEPRVEGLILPATDAVRWRVDRTHLRRGTTPLRLRTTEGTSFLEMVVVGLGPGAHIGLDIRDEWAGTDTGSDHYAFYRYLPRADYGLTGYYYNNPDSQPPAEVVRDDLLIATRPTQSGRFSIVWRGALVPEVAGHYTFTVLVDDGATVTLDGQELLNTQRGVDVADVDLSTRPTPIEIRYWNLDGSHKIELLWQLPGEPRHKIPLACLRTEPLVW